MPWAVAFGVPPGAMVAAGMPIPKWMDESGYIGAVLGAPLDVVKCETNNLYVPANAEFVFEGTASITETAEEGRPAHIFDYVLDNLDKYSRSIWRVSWIHLPRGV